MLIDRACMLAEQYPASRKTKVSARKRWQLGPRRDIGVTVISM